MGTKSQVVPTEAVDGVSVGSVKRSILGPLLSGMSALGVALTIERGASFISNVLAARLGGATVFGTYSLVQTTAMNVASYAGAGIGTTASRFAGQHSRGKRGYAELIRILLLVSLTSAAIAGIILWVGANPLARLLLQNSSLTPALKVGAVSAVAFVLLECCRGLLIGQRRFGLLVTLSVTVGGGLLLVVPSTARHGAIPMIAGQAAAVLAAVVAVAFLTHYVRNKHTLDTGEAASLSVWTVWRFGLVQLASVVGLNAAGWWTASLVARADTSLTGMAFYSIATQLRNMSALAPSLIAQSSFALFTEEGAEPFGGSSRVVLVSTSIATLLASVCAGLLIIMLPWTLTRLYGAVYSGAELPAALAITTGVIHMGTSPAAARLLIRSVHDSGVINAVWSVLVIVLGWFLIPGHGALAAVQTLLAAHAVSAFLVFIRLRRFEEAPNGLGFLLLLNVLAALALSGLAYMRFFNPGHMLLFGGAILAVLGLIAWIIVWYGQKNGILPTGLNYTVGHAIRASWYSFKAIL